MIACFAAPSFHDGITPTVCAGTAVEKSGADRTGSIANVETRTRRSMPDDEGFMCYPWLGRCAMARFAPLQANRTPSRSWPRNQDALLELSDHSHAGLARKLLPLGAVRRQRRMLRRGPPGRADQDFRPRRSGFGCGREMQMFGARGQDVNKAGLIASRLAIVTIVADSPPGATAHRV